MLIVVEYVYLPADGLRSYDVHALRHVPRFVDFALMIDLSFNGDLLMLGDAYTSLGSQVCLGAHRGPRWLWLIFYILRRLQRDLNMQDLDVVLLIIASVSANQ